MTLKRYTCKTCKWRFVLDLDNYKDTMGRYIDRRSILFSHMVEDHEYKAQYHKFYNAIHAHYEEEDLDDGKASGKK